MFRNRLCDPKRQNRSVLLGAATLVAVAAFGCADGGAEDQLEGTDDALAQSGPSVGSVTRDESPEGRNGVGSVTRTPVVPGGPTVGSEKDVGRVTRQPVQGGSLSGPYFADVTALGTGCPAGSWNAAISPDGQNFIVTFNAYAASVGKENKFSVKDCQLGIKLRSPQQVSYSVQGFRFSGYGYLEPGVEGTQFATFYVQGNPGNSIESRADFKGPYNGPYTLNADVELGKKLWSPCSAERDLRVQTRLRVNSEKPGSTGYLNLAAVNGTAKLVMRLSWRKCDDADELGKPSVDDSDTWPPGPSGGPVITDVDRDNDPRTPSNPGGGPVITDVDRDNDPRTPSNPGGGPVITDVDRDPSPRTPSNPGSGPVITDVDRSGAPSTPSTGPVVTDVDRSGAPAAPSSGPAVVGTERDAAPAAPSSGPVVTDATRS